MTQASVYPKALRWFQCVSEFENYYNRHRRQLSREKTSFIIEEHSFTHEVKIIFHFFAHKLNSTPQSWAIAGYSLQRESLAQLAASMWVREERLSLHREIFHSLINFPWRVVRGGKNNRRLLLLQIFTCFSSLREVSIIFCYDCKCTINWFFFIPHKILLTQDWVFSSIY